MKYLARFFWEKKGKTALILFLLLCQVTGTLLVPYLIAGIVDNGILAGNTDAIVRTSILMLIVALVTTAASVVASFLTADIAAMFGRNVRAKLFRKSQELSLKEFDGIGVSSMITRVTSDISNLQTTIGMLVQLAVPAPFIVVVALIMTAGISPALALMVAVCVVLLIVVSAVIIRKSNRLTAGLQPKLDRINQVVRESITGIRVIRAFGNERYEEERSGKAFEQYAGSMIALNRLFAVINPVVWLVMGAAMAAVIWLGGMFSLGGTMAVGEITAVIEYTIMTLSYVIMAASVSVMIPKMRACLSRVKEVLDMRSEIRDADTANDADGADAARTVAKSGAAAVAFDDVTFSYRGAEEPVLKHVSFKCAKGTTTAFIGSTGSGKSTIVQLLLRLHDVSSGRVLLNGIDIRDIPQQTLRERIGYVPQRAFLFSGTIADNLRMGREDAKETDMHRALRIAQAEEFVTSLPRSLESPVAQGGSNFSGGQKQRLAIARAIVRDADVYVFDDSFSALDLKTDAALRRELSRETADAVKIIVAQRVSTIVDADQIIVLDEGRIVGTGTHRDLLLSCSVYREIAESQMKKGA